MRGIIDKAALLICLLFIIAGSLVSLHRYWQYEVFFYDFGIFDQAIWLVSRFQAPVIDHLVVSGKWIFADHFNPSIFLLSPFYWLTDRSEIILIAQSVIVGLSGFIIYRIGKSLTNNDFFSLSIVICYFLFIGLQNAIISDFHEVTVMVLPLTLTFLTVVKRNTRLFFLFLIVTLGFKESTFLLGIGLGIFIFFSCKDWRKIGLNTIFLSVLWGVVAIKFLIPYFSGGIYQYTPMLHDNVLGNVTALFDEQIKRKTVFASFLSFGFLPLFSPSFWPLFLQDFASRFIPQFSNTRWDLGLHYNAQIAPLLAISSFYTFRIFQKIGASKRIFFYVSILLIGNALILYHFIFHGPLALSYNPAFYRHTNDFGFLDKMIDNVPKNTTVMAPNNLATRFTHQKVWLLRDNFSFYNPEYILIDVRPGQNPNNYFGVHDFFATVKKLKKDSSYMVIYKTEEQFILKKKH